ncbi:MAG: hypothetical protein ACRDFB_00525, partial [Rhabdochlamydiaceae bacterium]
MSEVSEVPRVEPPKFGNLEKLAGGKIRQMVRRLVRFVKRPERKYEGPKQPFSPSGMVETERKIDPTRAEKMENKGCAVRAIMSAVASILGVKSITATPEEWDIRFQQFASPSKDSRQELLELYNNIYPNKSTVLGNALKKVTVGLEGELTGKRIKERLHNGEQ